MLSALKKLVGGGTNRITGRTDILEAVCASASLVAAADGDISTDEVATALKVVANNEALSGAFDTRTIEATMDKMLSRASGGFSGKAGLRKEINDIAAKGGEDCDLVYLIALDVAYADGDVGDKERKVLNEIASWLKVDPKKWEG